MAKRRLRANPSFGTKDGCQRRTLLIKRPVSACAPAYRHTLQADVLKLVAKKLQSSLAVEGNRSVQPPSACSRAACLSRRTDGSVGSRRMIS